LQLQRIVFLNILDVRWQCFRNEERTRLQLKDAGFNKLEIIYDRARVFPTVLAHK
jgi:hypothetical protein